MSVIKKIIMNAAKSEFITERREQRNCARFSRLSEEQYSTELKALFKKKMGYDLNLDNPTTYNEKVQWLKLYDGSPLRTSLSDKLKMKEYVSEKVGSNYIVPVFPGAVWKTAADIKLEGLPEKFVLKTNHGCHTNIIFVGGGTNHVDLASVRKKMDRWMSMNFEFVNGFELQYRGIERRIFAEEYIDFGQNSAIDDYKVWCFGGKAYYIQHLTDRSTGLKMTFYDTKWEKQDFVYTYPQNPLSVKRPEVLDEMLDIAEKLSVGFRHTRIDFYILPNGRLKVGEITFTPAGGFCHWIPDKYDKKLGELIVL